MLDVGLGDCFIIQYYVSESEYILILIDAGNYGDGKKILSHLNKYYSGHSINYAIVTHPDNDHFGGFIYLLEKLEKQDSSDGIKYVLIKNFIVNDPGVDQKAKDYKWQRLDSRTQKKIQSVFDLDGHDNLIELIDRIYGVNRYGRFAGQYLDDKGIVPIMFIAPTKEYFERLVPSLRHGLHPIIKEEVYFSEKRKKPRDIDSEKDDSSTHNASSLIFVFYPYGKNRELYLFMGDATRAAFNEIPEEYRILIANCEWLKVPHHGSIHNLNTKIIRWINPRTAYISAPGNDDHPADEIIDYLKKMGVSVFSTNYHSDLLWRRGTEKRTNWDKVEPM